MKTEIDKQIDTMIASRSGKWDNRIAFTPKEIAEMLGLPPSTISAYCKQGYITPNKIGRHYLITRHALYDLLSQTEVTIL